jgi:hypothetical protein
MGSQEFYSNNFSSFVLENRPFFQDYKEKFVNTLYGYINKITGNRFTKEEITHFYDMLFISPFLDKNVINPAEDLALIYRLNDLGVDSVSVLNKLFLILSNSYIKYLIKKKNSVYRLKTMAMLLDFYIKYAELRKNTEEPETAKIPKEIKEIRTNKKHLNLFTIYKGIPIAHKTNIISLDEKEGIIKVSANSYQIIAAKFHKEIFLLENDREYSFRADIKKFTAYKKTMYLTNIEKVSRNAPKRSFIRVQPKEKIKALLKDTNSTLETVLYDISLRGLCVLGPSSDLKVSDMITAEFIIHLEKPYLINTEGEIKSVTKLDSKTYRYHIHFELPTHYEYILSKYITKREKEIVKELNAYISREFIALEE